MPIRTRPSHPSWCGGGHRCTIHTGVGEHRSRPMQITPPPGVAVSVAIVQRPGNRPRLELLLQLPLRGHDDQAHAAHGRRFLRAFSALLDREVRR